VTETRVTICIPHYMRENLLLKCLWAVKRNVRLPYRVIIINDSKKPLFFNDERITVINNLERRGLSAARQQFLELVDTEYLFFLDDDVIVLPKSLEVQIEALDNYPELAAVSGLRFSRFKLSTAANFEFKNKKLIRRTIDITEFLSSSDDLLFAHYIPICHTSFRTNVLKKIRFDSAYKMGYEHLDCFMQLYYTKWKCAIHRKSIFINLYYKSPREYRKERFRRSLLEASRRHFIEKWGYHPVDLQESKREVLAKLLKGLFNKSVLAIYARVLFNYPI